MKKFSEFIEGYEFTEGRFSNAFNALLGRESEQKVDNVEQEHIDRAVWIAQKSLVDLRQKFYDMMDSNNPQYKVGLYGARLVNKMIRYAYEVDLKSSVD
jgi:hypothetical protein